MSGGASEEAPPLPALRQAPLVAPVRLALGLAGLAAAVSIDLAAFLSGVLLGMGAVALVYALSVRP